MSIRIGFSTQGEFEIPNKDIAYTVSLTKDKELNTPDNSAPIDKKWFVHHPSGRKFVRLSIKNTDTANSVLKFSYTGGRRWSPLSKGDSWEGDVFGSFFLVKSDSDDTPFTFTASGV